MTGIVSAHYIDSCSDFRKTEMARFQAVLNHPSFRENPLSAIRAHVQQVFGQENK
jgi:hypothetical protein